MSRKKLKKTLAGFLATSMLLGTGSGYTLQVSAEGEEATVSLIWGNNDDPAQMVIAAEQPEGKDLIAKFIQNGTYTASSDDRVMFVLDNATAITGHAYGEDHPFFLSGNSTISFDGLDISSTAERFKAYDKTLTPTDLFGFYSDGAYAEDVDNNLPLHYDYAVTGEYTHRGFLWANALTVPEGKTFVAGTFSENEGEAKAGSLINAYQVNINGLFNMEKVEDDDKPTGLNILDNGSLTVGENGQLNGTEGSEIHILPGAKVNGLNLYEKGENQDVVDYTLPDEHGEEVFVYQGDKWVRQHFNNPNEKNQFIVYFMDFTDSEGNSKVKVEVDQNAVKSGDKLEYTVGQKITFKLTPPPERATADPVIMIKTADEKTYSNSEDAELQIELQDGEFSFTPESDEGFEVFINWSEYDMLNPGEDEILIRSVGWNCTVEPVLIAKDELANPGDENESQLIYDKNDMESGKVRFKIVPKEGNSLTFVTVGFGEDWTDYFVERLPEDGMGRKMALILDEGTGFTCEDGIYYYTVSKVSDYRQLTIQAYCNSNTPYVPEGIRVNKGNAKVDVAIGDGEFTELTGNVVDNNLYAEADKVSFRVTVAPGSPDLKGVKVRFFDVEDQIHRVPFPKNGIFTLEKGEGWKNYEIEFFDYQVLLDGEYLININGNKDNVKIKDENRDKETGKISFTIVGDVYKVIASPNDDSFVEVEGKDGQYSYEAGYKGVWIDVFETKESYDYFITQPDFEKGEFFASYSWISDDYAGGNVSYDVIPVKEVSWGNHTKLILNDGMVPVELTIEPDIRSDYEITFKGEDITAKVKENGNVFVWDVKADPDEPMIHFTFANKLVADVFKDVEKGAWYTPAVQFVFDHAFMNGVSKTSFGTKNLLTREQFVTVLYNLEGNPLVEEGESFKDVKPGEYYEDAVIWAKKHNITSGISKDNFGVGKNISRQQLVTLIYNYLNNYRKIELIYNDVNLKAFPDGDQVETWAEEAMQWAVSIGVINGKQTKDGNILDPNGEATRAECAQIIKQLYVNVYNWDEIQ